MNFDLLCLALGLVIGFGTGWLSYRGRQAFHKDEAESKRQALEGKLSSLQIEHAKACEHLRILEEQLRSQNDELTQERQFNISLHAELSRERASRNHLEQRIEQQKAELIRTHEKLNQELKALVRQVFEEESRSLTDLNKSSITSILQPIIEKFHDFNLRIEEHHDRETRELIVLHNKLLNLESNRPSPTNGAPPSNVTPVADQPNQPESDLEDQESDGFIEFTPSYSESSYAIDRENSVVQLPKNEASPENDAFHAFTPKQEVEIDNFLKRTLGRVQAKKPAP